MVWLPQRIVFFGVSRSGKSTLGALLEEHFGHETIAFADPIKRAAKEIFGFADEHLYGSSELRETPYPAFEFSGHCPGCKLPCERFDQKSSGAYWRCEKCDRFYHKFITPRVALQTLGTEWGRGLCKDLWARACFVHMRPFNSYVVTDGRFMNELQVAKELRACTVLLRRSLHSSTSTHPSEAEVRQMAEDARSFDLVLPNESGTVEDNFDRLVLMLSQINNGSISMRPYEDRTRGLR